MGCRYGRWLEIGLQLICWATGADLTISDWRLTALSRVFRNALGDVLEHTEISKKTLKLRRTVKIGKDGTDISTPSLTI
jgi:hypothetical protein